MLLYMPCSQSVSYTFTVSIHVKAYLLLIKIFFIFNIHLYLINESRVKINFLEQKYFAKKIIKLL